MNFGEGLFKMYQKCIGIQRFSHGKGHNIPMLPQDSPT